MRAMFLCMLMLISMIYTPFVSAQIPDQATIQENTDNILINVTYPIFDIPRIDEDVKYWASLLVENFWIDYREDAQVMSVPAELLVSYELTRPSATILSIVWEVASYTGGAHGNLEIITMTYDTENGALLDPLSLFGDPTLALERMSTYAFTILSNSLGNMHVESMLHTGTEPNLENFSSIALIPNGIRIYFQPYQVAPWAAGVQKVTVPLEALEDAKPSMNVWKH